MKNIIVISLTLLLGLAQEAWGTNTTITISNIDELKSVAQNVNSGTTNYSGYTILLDQDLEFDPTKENYFTPIGDSNTHYFAGIFDGQGHTISGINLKADGRQALFGTVNGGTVKNLTLASSTINNTSNSSAAGIVATIMGGGTTIENCHVTNSVSITGDGNVGGIVAYTHVGTINIVGCTSAASVEMTGNGYSIGGVVGVCGNEETGSNYATDVTVSNCLYYGTSVSNSSGSKGAIVGSYATTSHSTVTLSNNFYTYLNASVKGIGHWRDNNDNTYNIDRTASHGAVLVRIVSSEADIADMGSQSATYTGGIAIYANGAKYGDQYYSHVLALPDGQDNTSLISQYDGMTFDVKLRGRILYKDGSWNTLSLPFALDNLNGTIFATTANCEVRYLDLKRYLIQPQEGEPYGEYYTGVNDGKLYLFFRQTTSIGAATPYIVKWERAENYNSNDPAQYDYQSPTFSDVTITNSLEVYNSVTSTDGKVTFQSTFAPFTREYLDRTILFLGDNDKLYYPSGTGPATVGPFRAYFTLNGVEMADGDGGGSDSGDDYIPADGGGDARLMVIDFIDEASAIVEAEASASPRAPQPSEWFTLDGRKLSHKPSRAGVYIYNGKKVAVK